MVESAAIQAISALQKYIPAIANAIEGMKEITENQFPEIAQEIKGTAAGVCICLCI